MRWFPLALLFGASFTAAQNLPPSAATSDSQQKPIRVEGTILSLNGEGVRKATVRLQGTVAQFGQLPTNYSESTANDGAFVFEDVAPGRYTLSAERTGFIATRYGARSNTSPGTQLNLTPGMELKDLSIKMTPQGVIAGKVLDQDGDPVAGVQVQVMRYAYQRGRKQLQSNGAVSTNDLGEYRIGNLVPGRYYISATDRRTLAFAQDRAGRAGNGQEANITTYYPNGTDASSAAPIEVAAGGEMRGVDIRLLQAKVYTVRGKAVDESGMPSSTVVSFNAANALPQNGAGVTQLRPDGTFEFRNIIPGAYVLQVVQATTGNAPANVTGRVEVTVGDANIDGLVLPLGPGPEITGSVRLENGDIATLIKPAQNAAGPVPAGSTMVARPIAFTLMPSEADAMYLSTPNAQVKEDGTFRFNSVGPGKYVLNAISLPPGTYLKSARFGGQEVTRAPIDVTSGSGGTLDIVLSSKAADIAGSVQNDKGEALAGVIVTLWPQTSDASFMGGSRQANTDQNGGFRFQNLTPGEYDVAAWEELEPGLTQSADFLNHFTNEASAIKLAEGGHESPSLKPVPSDRIVVEIAKLP